MSAEPVFCTRSWSAGRYTATLSMRRPTPGAVCMAVMSWEPEPPLALNEEELRQYRAGRNQALAEISAALGMNAAVLEV